ncbi:hypothetical protein RJT34_06492 [Clitoria ternatea]|uniref:Uncharacterized protein n=1 Tax=Clitoria ternatea TaxID=43366 RepID=A0AAN9K2C5_CLITE
MLVPVPARDNFVDSSHTTKAIANVLKAQWDGPYISWTDAGKWAEGKIDEIRKVFATKTSKIIKSTLWKEAYKARRAEKEANLVASTPEGEVPPTLSCSDDNAIYMEAIRGVNNKWGIFGLGGVGTQLAKKGKTSSSSSSSGLPTEVVQQRSYVVALWLPVATAIRGRCMVTCSDDVSWSLSGYPQRRRYVVAVWLPLATVNVNKAGTILATAERGRKLSNGDFPCRCSVCDECFSDGSVAVLKSIANTFSDSDVIK